MFSGNVVSPTVIVAGKTFVLFGLRSLFTVLKSAVSVNSRGASVEKSGRDSAVTFLDASVASSGNGALGSFAALADAGAAFCCAEPATDNTQEISTATIPYVQILNPASIPASQRHHCGQSYVCSSAMESGRR